MTWTRIDSSRSCGQGSDSGYMWKVDPMVFADGLDMVWERRVESRMIPRFWYEE